MFVFLVCHIWQLVLSFNLFTDPGLSTRSRSWHGFGFNTISFVLDGIWTHDLSFASRICHPQDRTSPNNNKVILLIFRSRTFCMAKCTYANCTAMVYSPSTQVCDIGTFTPTISKVVSGSTAKIIAKRGLFHLFRSMNFFLL